MADGHDSTGVLSPLSFPNRQVQVYIEKALLFSETSPIPLADLVHKDKPGYVPEMFSRQRLYSQAEVQAQIERFWLCKNVDERKELFEHWGRMAESRDVRMKAINDVVDWQKAAAVQVMSKEQAKVTVCVHVPYTPPPPPKGKGKKAPKRRCAHCALVNSADSKIKYALDALQEHLSRAHELSFVAEVDVL